MVQLNKYRIGFGYDVHRLKKGRKLILGGVEIPFTHGLDGHSDADVLLHAICDALLGALADGDIGQHFPNTDLKYKNVSSLKLLAKVNNLINRKGYNVVNIDTTLVMESPKIVKYKKIMEKNICSILKNSGSCINIKATTNEGLGFIGSGEGICAYAIALLTKSND